MQQHSPRPSNALNPSTTNKREQVPISEKLTKPNKDTPATHVESYILSIQANYRQLWTFRSRNKTQFQSSI